MKQGERLAAVSEGGVVKRDPIVDYHCTGDPSCGCQVHVIMRAATNDRGVELSPGDTLVIATLLQQSIAINEALKEHGVDVVRRGGRQDGVHLPASTRASPLTPRPVLPL